MNIELRREQPPDYRETENMTREAFWNHYSPGCDEHYLLHIARGCPAFVPELDIIAVHDGKIVGNIIYLKALIAGDDGTQYEVLSLGPISVLPEYQSKGIGRKMIAYTKKVAHEMGFRAILLCGDPEIYSRFGFIPAEALGIRTADNMFMAALHLCELYEGALSGIKGWYYEDSIYSVDEKPAAEFDSQFPMKEKIVGTPTQKRFDFLSEMMRKAD